MNKTHKSIALEQMIGKDVKIRFKKGVLFEDKDVVGILEHGKYKAPYRVIMNEPPIRDIEFYKSHVKYVIELHGKIGFYANQTTIMERANG